MVLRIVENLNRRKQDPLIFELPLFYFCTPSRFSKSYEAIAKVPILSPYGAGRLQGMNILISL